MRVKANISFCGSVCMAANEVKDIPEGGVLSDLLEAGYVTEVQENSPAAQTAASENPPRLVPEVKLNENKRGKPKSD